MNPFITFPSRQTNTITANNVTMSSVCKSVFCTLYKCGVKKTYNITGDIFYYPTVRDIFQTEIKNFLKLNKYNKEKIMDSKTLTKEICNVLVAKKAQDIVKINVERKSSLTDYFIIASGRSTTQVKALCEYVEEALSKQGVDVKRREGESEGRWAVLDYGDCIVHIFDDENRLFYHLEKLWEDGDNFERIASDD